MRAAFRRDWPAAAGSGNGDKNSRCALGAGPYYMGMLMLASTFAFLSVILGRGFYRKYRSRLRIQSQNTLRYNRIADYFGRPILLSFEYRFHAGEQASPVEADVDEIYHYGNDYFLKGQSPDGKRCHIYKWSRIANPRVRFDGRNLESLEQLFSAAEGFGFRAVA
jgi:hypothetical protein